MESTKYYIGIDPGKTGYTVVMNEDKFIVECFPTPLIGKEYDKQLMKDYLKTASKLGDVHAVLEDVHATQMGGKVRNFDFGRGKGLWEMALMALDIPHTMVTPKEWQKYMWQGAKIQYKPTKRITKAGNAVKAIDTKATSALAAKNLRPDIEWRRIGKKGTPTTKIDDGFVDAYLMCEYCRRKFR